MSVKVSIVTPTFNSSATISHCLDSIHRQSYNPIEHIIKDGGSQDDTLQIIDTYPANIKVVSDPDSGLYDAMNIGLETTTGDIVGILNSDDFYTDETVIEEVVKTMEETGVDLIYGDLNYINEEMKVTRRWIAGNYERSDFLYGWMPPHPTVFVRRHVYERIGNFRLDMGSSADYEWLLRALYKYEVSSEYINRTLVHMRIGGVSNASLKNRFHANQFDRKAWKVNGLKIKWYTALLKPLRKIKQWTFLS